MSTLPARPPKSSTRYDKPTDGPYCCRCVSKPCGASGCACVAATSTVTVGRNAPRLAPNTSAAERACAHDSRVDGLLRSARSTISDTPTLPNESGSAGVAAVAVGMDFCSRTASPDDGVQYSLG